MKTNTITTTRKRVNITLPVKTVELLDHLIEKGARSRLISEAVLYYIKELGRKNLQQKLKEGAISRAKRDVDIVDEWFPLDEEVWAKKIQ